MASRYSNFLAFAFAMVIAASASGQAYVGVQGDVALVTLTGGNWTPMYGQTSTGYVYPVVNDRVSIAVYGSSGPTTIDTVLHIDIEDAGDGWLKLTFSGADSGVGYAPHRVGGTHQIRSTPSFNSLELELSVSGLVPYTFGLMNNPTSGGSGVGDLSSLESLMQELVDLHLTHFGPGQLDRMRVDQLLQTQVIEAGNLKLDDIAATNNIIASAIQAVQLDTVTIREKSELVQADVQLIREMLEAAQGQGTFPNLSDNGLPDVDELVPAFSTPQSGWVQHAEPFLPDSQAVAVPEQWEIFDIEWPGGSAPTAPESPPVWNISIPNGTETPFEMQIDWAWLDEGLRLKVHAAILVMVGLFLGWRVFDEFRRYG